MGVSNGCHGDHLQLNEAAFEDFLRAHDPRIERVRVGVAAPGDATRILCCKDIVQPRLKLRGAVPGEGTLRVVDNLAIVTCGPIVGFQEGIIDMSGPGSSHTPFSQLNLVVLQIEVRAGITPHDHEAALRDAGLAAAQRVAHFCRDLAPQTVEDIAWNEIDVDPALPRLAYVYMLLSQGLLHDSYLLGENARSGLPRLLDPRVALDNGVISGNCVSACDKNTTFHHQNNPLIELLLRGHGSRWNFAGVVVTNAATRLAEKERSASRAVDLAAELGAQGAIVSKEGFGNPDADLMMLVRGLEQAGIRCVGLTDEFAGGDGASQSLADVAAQADAIISTGNANERIVLPPMTTTFGPLPDVARLAGGYPASLRADGSMEVELQAIMGATNELGYGYLRCEEV